MLLPMIRNTKLLSLRTGLPCNSRYFLNWFLMFRIFDLCFSARIAILLKKCLLFSYFFISPFEFKMRFSKQMLQVQNLHYSARMSLWYPFYYFSVHSAFRMHLLLFQFTRSIVYLEYLALNGEMNAIMHWTEMKWTKWIPITNTNNTSERMLTRIVPNYPNRN